MPLSGKIKMDDIGGKSLGLSIMMNLASEEGISQAKKTVLTKKRRKIHPNPATTHCTSQVWLLKEP